jgi:LysM repeat protein
MIRLTLLLGVAALLVACSGGGDSLPTRVPTADVNAPAATGDESPRATPPSGLPPTWTPAPSPSPLVATQPAAPGAPPAPAAGQQTYEVQRGDTLAEIAARFNVSLDALAAANGITNIDHIEVGQVLIIP